MPHQCTTCGHTFPDGSKEMLSGCPDCGGNKFQFYPHEVPDEPPEDAEPPEPDESGVATAVGRAANTVRDLMGSTDEPGAGTGADVGTGPAAPERADADTDGPATAAEPSASTPDDRTAASSAATAETVDDGSDASDAGGPVVSDSVGLDLSSGATDPNDALDDAAVIEDGPIADGDANPDSPGDRPHTDALTDKEWPAVSRPDDAEDAAQADARSSFVGPDDAAVEGAAADETADASATEVSDGDEASTPTVGDEDETDPAPSTDDEPDLGDIRIAEEEPIDSDTDESDAADDDRLREVGGPDSAATSTPEQEADEAPTAAGSPHETKGVEPVESPDGEASPGLEELRAELNEQFESIRIVEPGQYELNLMELYERQEYIIALQEDGRYVVEVPDTWE